MVKIDYFDIQFEAENKLYYAGQRICGALIIRLQDPLKASGISVTLLGESKTSWVNKMSDKIFESTETYINERIDITYLDDVSDGELLPEGVHSMPFSFQLPTNLPSTYEGDYGYVRYKVCACIKLSPDNVCMIPALQSLKELTSDKSLTVLGLVDVRDLVKTPESGICREDSFETVGCWCARGTIEASISVQRAGYIVGKPLPVNIKVTNRSGSKKMMNLLLLQEAHFQSKSRYESVCDTKILTRVVESVSLETLENHKTISKQISVDIPFDLTPTSVLRNSLISISYKFKLEFGNNLELVMPVIITTHE